MTRAAIFGAVVLLASPAPCQDQSAQPTFRAGTELIQVSVIAHDKEGKPVTDLRQQDFQIFDNGAPREIRLFLSDTEAPAQPETRTPGSFSNKLSTSGNGGYSVLLFDNLNVDPARAAFGHTARARQHALQALREIPPGDRIAIYALGCRFQVVREFSSDRDSILQQLQKFAPAPGACLDPPDPGDQSTLGRRSAGMSGVPMSQRVASGATAIPGFEGHEAEGVGDVTSRMAADIADNEIRQLAEHLAGIPGRKNLIWLTTTFGLAPANLRKLINAGVVIYPVDTRGSIIALESEKKAMAAPLQALAAQTGGMFYFDRDDLDVAIREALNDGRVSYTLGFYQGDPDKPASVHQLRVEVNRPDVNLRYRTSYATPAPQPPSTNPVQGLVDAMNRPINATAIGITASASRAQNQLDLSVDFEISGLDLQLDNALWKGQAELVARFVTAEGLPAGNTLAETMTFNLRPATYASMSEKGARYHKQISIPAGAVELKLLVGSLSSGRIGTLTIPLSEIHMN